jgi:GNAT superfamily N-acetyltransferase
LFAAAHKQTLAIAPAAWINDCHARHDADHDGFDSSFGVLVAGIVAAFFVHHDHARERGWVALQQGEPTGYIFCVAGPAGTAKLRLFYLEPGARGTGLAQALLDTCMDFARSAAYPVMRLWTHESHRAADRLYARNSFAMMESHHVPSFGQTLVSQTWEPRL